MKKRRLRKSRTGGGKSQSGVFIVEGRTAVPDNFAEYIYNNENNCLEPLSAPGSRGNPATGMTLPVLRVKPTSPAFFR